MSVIIEKLFPVAEGDMLVWQPH